jgi:hypothetical protein
MSKLSDRYLCIDGRTPSGRRLQIWADSSHRTTLGTIYPSSQAREIHVLIDGAEWTVMRWDTMRDGGTQTIKLARRPDLTVEHATLLLPHRLSCPDRIPRLDGEDVYERRIPQERYDDVIAWRLKTRVQYERVIRRVADRESGRTPGVVISPPDRAGYGLPQMMPSSWTDPPPEMKITRHGATPISQGYSSGPGKNENEHLPPPTPEEARCLVQLGRYRQRPWYRRLFGWLGL